MKVITISALNGVQLPSLELTVTTVFTVVVMYWCYCKWNRRHIDKLDRKLKGPPVYPIIGSVPEVIGYRLDTFDRTVIMENLVKMNEKYGPEPFKIWCGPYFMVNIIRPEDIQIIINNSNALEKGPFYKFLKSSLGDGLLTAGADKWRKHHRLISPAFNSTASNQFLPVFNENTLTLINNLKAELGRTQMFNIWDYVFLSLTDTICQTSMGYNYQDESLTLSELRDILAKGSELVSMRFSKPWLYPDILFNIYLMITGQQNTFETARILPKKAIKENREKLLQKKMSKKTSISDETEGKRFKMFIDTLLELNEAGADFSDEELLGEVSTIIVSAIETTSTTTCFCLLMLAIHQDIQDKVYDEIYSIFGDDDRPMTISDVTKLVYFKQVLNESLRLLTPVPITLRLLQNDVKIFSDDIVLPKGTTCFLSAVGTHHLAELYPNPWMFNPENFNPENVAKRHKYAFVPFSGGQRKCIGYNYATLQIQVIICTFLRNFSVHTEIGLSDVKYQFDVTMKLAQGFPITIQPKNRKSSQK